MPRTYSNKQLLDAACCRNRESWRVVQIRVAPYETALPGSPQTWQDFAQVKNQHADRMIQLRFHVKPFCAQRSGKYIFRDHAFHFVFNIRPDNQKLAEQIFEPLQKYQDLQNQGISASDANEREQLYKLSYSEKTKHLTALNSQVYREFRMSFLKQFSLMSEAHNTLPEMAFQNFWSLVDTIEQRKYFSQNPFRVGPKFNDLSHTGLAEISGFQNTVKTFTHQYATRRNFEKATFLTTLGGRI